MYRDTSSVDCAPHKRNHNEQNKAMFRKRLKIQIKIII